VVLSSLSVSTDDLVRLGTAAMTIFIWWQNRRVKRAVDDNTTKTEKAVSSSEKAVAVAEKVAVLVNGAQTPQLRTIADLSKVVATVIGSDASIAAAKTAEANLADHEAAVANVDVIHRLPDDPTTSHK
jgi:hypothetical protein